MTTTDTDTTTKRRTITLTHRPPVSIVEDQWLMIATARDWDGEHEFQANRKWSVRVREHADGRRLVYGTYDSAFMREPDLRGGYLLDPPGAGHARGDDMAGATVRAIRALVEEIGGADSLASRCIADLPAVDL